MQVRIQAHDFDLTPALRSHVTQRVRFALTRYRDHVRRIEVANHLAERGILAADTLDVAHAHVPQGHDILVHRLT